MSRIKKKVFKIDEFSDLHELRKRVSRFIYINYFTLQDRVDTNIKYCKNIIKDFEDLVKSCAKEYNVDNDLVRAYFTMDKYIYPRVARYTKSANTCKNVCVVIEGFEDKPLNNSNYLKAYSSKNVSFIEKLEENCDLLPDYSKQYIKNKMNEAPADAKIVKITNDFQLKAAENMFIKSPTYLTANKLFRTFLNCDDYHDKFNSLFGLFIIVSENSHLVEQDIEDFNNLVLEIAKKSKHPLERCLGYGWGADFDSVAKFLKNKKSDKYIDIMVDKFPKTNVHFLLNFAKSQESIDKLHRRISRIISSDDETFGMNFDYMSDELKQIIVEENIRQYFEYSKPKWALWK